MAAINWTEFLYPYQQAVDELLVKFSGIIREYTELGQYSPIESVSGRIKKVSSIIEKANRKSIPLSCIEGEIEDIAGLRILCQFVEDIEKVKDIIRNRDGMDMYILEERDYITNTKPSGYRSYHFIIKYPIHGAFGRRELLAEIQIRTLAMNFWATTEHTLNYKYSGNIPEKLHERLKYCAEAAFNLDKEMSTIREEIMYAERLNEIKNNLVNKIIENMQKLYFVAQIGEMDRINKDFAELWEEGDLEKLKEFNEQLMVMSELYRV
ncbi:MAG: GTP pyrophosphokinase family protein [Firmicutes bacterium]|nr:GTP pyrophosphokinase family protein [Bacillota bacterium]